MAVLSCVRFIVVLLLLFCRWLSSTRSRSLPGASWLRCVWHL